MTETRQSDEELLARYCASGDHSSFEELVGRYWEAIGRWARKIVHDAESAEDVRQLSLLKLMKVCGSFQGRSRFASWFYAVVRSEAINYSHRGRRRPALFSDLGIYARTDPSGQRRDAYANEPMDPAPFPAEEDDLPDVREAVAKLSPQQRELVAVIYFHDSRYAEAAVLFRVPIGTIRSRLHRAIETLRGIVKAEGECGRQNGPAIRHKVGKKKRR